MRITTTRTTALCASVLAVSFLMGLPALAKEPSAETRLSGPYQHHNLSVHLVHGVDRLDDGDLLTLSEAMKAGLVVVHETGQVSELSIENRSVDKAIFIQAGGIVKGGRQDRVLSRDLLVQASSGRVPIGAFCVERGRWQRRGNEDAVAFRAASHMLNSKELKIAALVEASQADVWSEVAASQDKLAAKLGRSVQADRSATSLQLSLEDGGVVAKVAGYEEALGDLARSHPDAVGFAFAIGGELNSVEVYASHGLFQRQWPRLLRAVATEAVAESSTGAGATPPPKADDVVAFMRASERGALRESSAPGNVSRETGEAYFLESRRPGKDDWLHRSYLKK